MVGIPELVTLSTILVSVIAPVAIGVWVLVTLHRVRVGQDAVQAKLESIERLLQRA
jgi:hypothetical protein